MYVFEEKWKPEYPRKTFQSRVENQQTQPWDKGREPKRVYELKKAI